MSNSCFITVKPILHHKSQTVVFVSKNIINKLKLNESHTFIIKCGEHYVKVSFEIEENNRSEMKCHTSLLDQLCLPHEDLNLQLIVLKDKKTLMIGPFFGVMTDSIFKEEKHFGAITPFYEELSRFCEKLHTCLYVFNTTDWHDDFVSGYLYLNNNWLKANVPFPNVIHNRIHSRIYEKTEDYEAFRKAAETYNIPIFNAMFLNKWDVHTILSEQPSLEPYLPYTELLSGRSTIRNMLIQYQSIFIKPVHGSQGRQIYRISRNEDSTFSLDYSTFSSNEVDNIFASDAALYQSLRSRLNKQRFLAQQAIPLLSYHNRPVDFRFLCHCAHDYQWKISSAVARVSSEEQFVSNLAQGGELMKIEEVLSFQFNESHAKQIKRALAEIAIEISTVLSKESTGIYGEFGIDLAVDNEGKPWIIEVNTKPSKSLDTPNTSIRPSAKSIIKFGHFLSRFH